MIDLVKKLTAQGKLAGQATREQDLRSYLGQFNFSGDMVKQAVGSMSGGEKARLVLCMIVWQRPNLLLLDEPTNHLDLATREALSVALNEFEGTVILVSHDRALLRSVCDEFWLVSRGGIAPFEGDLDDYQNFLLEESKRLRAEAIAQTSPAKPQADQAWVDNGLKNKQLQEKKKPLKKELELVEPKLAALEKEKESILQKLLNPPDPQEIAEVSKRLKLIEKELAELEARWLEINEALEALEVL
jgi:ATP-binding cassette subfamily F protein 3